MIDHKVIPWGAAGIITVFMALLMVDAVPSIDYDVPLPLYGTIGLIFGGGAVLGVRSKLNEKKEEPSSKHKAGGPDA